MKVDLKKSRFGRVLRRLAGERKGAVLMEYIILGVLIAAAVVGSAFMLAKVFHNGMATMGTAIGSGQEEVKKQMEELRKELKQDKTKALETVKGVNGEK